jgi:hypothetical protein
MIIDHKIAFFQELKKLQKTVETQRGILKENLLFCMHKHSKSEKKMLYRYTRNQQPHETKSEKFRKLHKKYKPRHIQMYEDKLSQYSASTV